MRQDFEPHGEFDMRLSGRTLIMSLTGAFNKEGTQALTRQARQLVESSLDDGAPWAILSDNRNMELTTPDIYEVIEQQGPWFVDHGLSFEAVVAPGHIQRDNIKKIHASIASRYTIAYFDTMAEARHWLQNKGMF